MKTPIKLRPASGQGGNVPIRVRRDSASKKTGASGLINMGQTTSSNQGFS